MKLKKFLENFSHNNLVRLLYKTQEDQHMPVGTSWDDVMMDWELKKDEKYKNREVVKIISVSVDGLYPEAINIVIDK